MVGLPAAFLRHEKYSVILVLPECIATLKQMTETNGKKYSLMLCVVNNNIIISFVSEKNFCTKQKSEIFQLQKNL